MKPTIKKRRLLYTLLFVAGLLLVLCIPDNSKPSIVSASSEQPFQWNSDSLWMDLEQQFEKASVNQADLPKIIYAQTVVDSLLATLPDSSYGPGNSTFNELLQGFFRYALQVAATHQFTDSLRLRYIKLRKKIKEQSEFWPENQISRTTLYRLMYGSRAAWEEVILQTQYRGDPLLIFNTTNDQEHKCRMVRGTWICSGDLLLSRGGAPVSALIARASNFQGNFSHVAVVHVDDSSGVISLIESHIEKGVAVSDTTAYLADKKQRICVLRINPGILKDEGIPHTVAAALLKMGTHEKIPYDFEMNTYDSNSMFCSEVASYGYSKSGIRLWNLPSSISNPGAVSWLNAFGVTNFVSQMPSDLEYDRNIEVVAEWYDTDLLLNDHLYNAAMDGLYSRASLGKEPGYNHFKLPLARLLKGWCMIKNAFGGIGAIPEGMSATVALKNVWLTEQHQQLLNQLKKEVELYEKQHHHLPPYWQMVAMAEKIAKEQLP